jgi:voltage-gated potassium channel
LEKPSTTSRFLTLEMRYRYTALLVFIVTLLSVLPFIEGAAIAIYGLRVLVLVVLIYAIYAGGRGRRDLILGSALGIPAVAGRWLPQYTTDIPVFVVVDILTAVFLLYTTITILNQIFSARRVTLDTIAGAVCAYLLIGLGWAFVYRVLFVTNPQSFLAAPGSVAPNSAGDIRARLHLMRFVYYSFTTLTTTGFGDITPISGPSRGISILEAIAGQFFLAVLIARLVSLEIIHSTRRDLD